MAGDGFWESPCHCPQTNLLQCLEDPNKDGGDDTGYHFTRSIMGQHLSGSSHNNFFSLHSYFWLSLRPFILQTQQLKLRASKVRQCISGRAKIWLYVSPALWCFYYPTAGVLKLWHRTTQRPCSDCWAPPPHFWFSRSGGELKQSVFLNKFPSNSNATGVETTLWKPLG